MFPKIFFVVIATLFVAEASVVPIVPVVVDTAAPQPYAFGYNVKDAHSDQFREEVSDGAGAVKGSYGFADARGIQRLVDYVADHGGFRAQVKTNEPGTANQNPANVRMISNAGHVPRAVVVEPVVEPVVVQRPVVEPVVVQRPVVVAAAPLAYTRYGY